MTTTSKPSVSATADARVALLADRQAGAFSRQQAFDVGFSRSGVSRRLNTGRWRSPYPGVYRLAGCPKTWMQEVWAAYLAVGPSGALSHETATNLHGVELLPKRPVTLTVAHGGHARLEGVVVHQIDDLTQRRVINLAGLPVTTTARAIVDLAATRTEQELARVLDVAVRERRTSYAKVGVCFAEVMRPHKPGMAKLARVLEARDDGYVPAQSELEQALFAALAAGGLPQPVRQFRLPGRGVISGLVDAAFLLERVLVEADGRRWHTRVDDLRRDHERDTEAARAGYLTLRFVYEQIIYEPAEVCAAIADVLRSRAMLPPVPRS